MKEKTPRGLKLFSSHHLDSRVPASSSSEEHHRKLTAERKAPPAELTAELLQKKTEDELR